MGYDLVLNRRLWGDVVLMLDYSFYKIKDYIASNSQYARYSGSSAGNLRYSDYKINLDEVYRQGLEINLAGHLSKDLSFYLTYAWQDFENQGHEPAGTTELDDRARNRVTAGLRYHLLTRTALKLDYAFQDKKTIEESELIDDSDPDNPIYSWRRHDNPAYHSFNLGVEQTLCKAWGPVQDAKIEFYIKNLFDEDYCDARGYPATDRTFGTTLSFRM